MAEVVGLHPVPDAPEPCFLVEMIVPTAGFDFGEITQPDPDRPTSDWQVPWDEQVIESEGGDTRVAFFFHYLDPNMPLVTPWGELSLPKLSERPPRLESIAYEEP